MSPAFGALGPAVLPGSGGLGGVPVPGWVSVLIIVVCVISAVTVLLLIRRNRRR
ncbi:hypothetical protein [Amycolatopsis sp. PS_44_ISF1]|uniref:hypothetical protein n=1 Tax=Amycolatopsis sp. PS_44_ISF1 TaxID=2974917 RepID=UPI0028DF2BB5|nr:hypothetical protein [Amycolatopsis sp. PS_44_ISF1]MDT8914911.1 hypothetical protein [Amycolatopsis sp. PS_44_ISF1]